MGKFLDKIKNSYGPAGADEGGHPTDKAGGYQHTGNEEEEEDMDFLTKFSKQKIEGGDGPATSDLQSGTAHPDNWQNKVETTLNEHELRDLAVTLHDSVARWQNEILAAEEAWSCLMGKGGKYAEQFSPIIYKGLSRDKLLKVAELVTKLAQGVQVK